MRKKLVSFNNFGPMKLVVRLSTKSMEKPFAIQCWHTVKKLFEKKNNCPRW